MPDPGLKPRAIFNRRYAAWHPESFYFFLDVHVLGVDGAFVVLLTPPAIFIRRSSPTRHLRGGLGSAVPLNRDSFTLLLVFDVHVLGVDYTLVFLLLAAAVAVA